MASTTLAAALSGAATSITVPNDEALASFPDPQFSAWIGTEQVLILAGPPTSATWTILRDQTGGNEALFIDTFDRDESATWGNGWGRASSQLYVLEGAGYIAPAGSGRQPFQASVVPLDCEVRFSFSADQLATGDDIDVFAIFRDSGSLVSLSTFYRAGVHIRSDTQLMRVHISRGAAGVTTYISVPQYTTTGLTFVAGTTYWLVARCSGVSPTTLEVKVWADGTAEPAAWTISASDSTGPQVAGYPGVRFTHGSSWTGTPLISTFYDYSVQRIPVGKPWASGTTVQSIDPVDPATLLPVGDGPPISQPPDGASYVDRTNNRLYVRTLGVWRYTTLT